MRARIHNSIKTGFTGLQSTTVTKQDKKYIEVKFSKTEGIKLQCNAFITLCLGFIGMVFEKFHGIKIQSYIQIRVLLRCVIKGLYYT